VFSVLFVAAAFWPAFYGTGFLRANKELVGTWVVACIAMSSFTLLPAMKVEDVNLMYVYHSFLESLLTSYNRMAGGFLMVAVGLSYLVFEKKLLDKSKLPGDSTVTADNSLSRALIGAQVGYNQS